MVTVWGCQLTQGPQGDPAEARARSQNLEGWAEPTLGTPTAWTWGQIMVASNATLRIQRLNVGTRGGP